jgi:hypothetical protein
VTKALWTVCKDFDGKRWVAQRGWHTEKFPTWEEAFAFAYRKATAAIHEVP